MPEFFITARSFAVPFFSDESEKYVEAETAQLALEQFASNYAHPAGLYAAEAWASADDFHRDREPKARWLSNHLVGQREATKDMSAYSYMGIAPGKFELNGELVEIENPKGGCVVDAL